MRFGNYDLFGILPKIYFDFEALNCVLGSDFDRGEGERKLGGCLVIFAATAQFKEFFGVCVGFGGYDQAFVGGIVNALCLEYFAVRLNGNRD